jgi:hypothetical protein
MRTILKTERSRTLARRAGIAGFLFFLLKGLLWLSLPILLGVKGCTQ